VDIECACIEYLNLGLDIFDGVAGLHFQGDGLARQSLDKDLHATSQTQNQMKRRFLLDVVVAQCTTIFQLLPSKYQTLLVRRNTLLVLQHVTNHSTINLNSDNQTKRDNHLLCLAQKAEHYFLAK